MSFTREVKRELDGVLPVEGHCRCAQLTGIVFSAGTIEIGSGGRLALRVTLSSPAGARHLLALLGPYRVKPELRTVETARMGRRFEAVLGAQPRHLQLLNEIGVLTDDFRVRLSIPHRVVERRCCAAAFLRGAFLGCGSISTPGTAVHAEFTVEGEELAHDVVRILARLGLTFGTATRGRNVAVYTKRGETAADLMAILGAHAARLRWEEHAVLGRVRESANRLANCDEANARRAAQAGARQVLAARRLMASEKWETAPAVLRDAAVLRVRQPHLSLAELAASAEPPLSKSALNHRLRRITTLAAGLPGRSAASLRPAGAYPPGGHASSDTASVEVDAGH